MSEFKVAFIADLHHYSEKLGNSGRAYELREGSDQKCLKETGAIIDKAFLQILEDSADAVCVAGDITNDGERVSHDEIFERFSLLAEKKSVYVITSTHDWCSDHNPRRFEGEEVFGDVDTMSPEELRKRYSVFGKENCLSSYRTALGLESRCYQLCPGLRLLAVHDDCDGPGGSSGYCEEHLAWMTEQLKDARESGCKCIAMEHHLLLHPFCRLINSGQSIGNNFETAARLADAGLRLMLVGHSHMQRTTEFVSPQGNKITQINLGALTGYPAPITYISFDGENAAVSVRFLDEFTYNGNKCGFNYFREHTLGVLFNLLEAGAADKEDFSQRLRAQGIKVPSFDTLYPVIRFVCKRLLRARCGMVGGFINFLTLGRAIPRKALREIKDMPLLQLVGDVFLGIFDGSAYLKGAREAEKRVVCSVGALASRIIRRLPLKNKDGILKTTDQIEALTRELMYPSLPDNMNTVIAL